MLKKTLIIMLLFVCSVVQAQKTTSSNKILLDSICYYLCLSETVKSYYFHEEIYGIRTDTAKLEIHLGSMDDLGPGKASVSEHCFSFYLNHLESVSWRNDSNYLMLTLNGKGVSGRPDNTVAQFVHLFWGRTEYTAYYYYDIAFNKLTLSPKKQIMISQWINQLIK